ncbi:hypothetical protein AXF42_Ash000537 [Apostasia shenzhenica]|uniref:Uncharacterized protein n=1 Tax=Apostasia shenzhenica TaxID=1088818 RepID=A0A2I0AGM6_9ASPA|nr:hypothetical protein AXF42_Ash000537 [Apostasia shenzhenica]
MADEVKGLAYWIQWQVAVCALIAILPGAAAVAVIIRKGRPPLRASDLWAPCWAELSPFLLLTYRASVFLVMSWVLSQTVLMDGAGAFFFYTQWTFMLVIIYFLIGTLISVQASWYYLRRNNKEIGGPNGLLKGDVIHSNTDILNLQDEKDGIRLTSHREGQIHDERAGFWGHVMLIVYQISAGAVMLTDVVFWGLLVPFMTDEHFRLNLILVSMHSINVVFLLIDTSLNMLPFPWFGMAYFVIWSCFYLTFQWVLHACGLTWWPYPFMELSTPWAPLWYLAIALVHIPCFSAYFLIAKAKNSIFSKLFPNSFIKSY